MNGEWKALGPALRAALQEYDRTGTARLLKRQTRDAVATPLYHYTTRGGLEGIVVTQQIWFTHFRHLNDPQEVEFGLSVAKDTLAEVGNRYGGFVKSFCSGVSTMLSMPEMLTTFGFYIASFSRSRDDLLQWRFYADNARVFARGLARHLFAIEDKLPDKAHEDVFVAPVHYGEDDGRLHHLPAIEGAARIIEKTFARKTDQMRDRDQQAYSCTRCRYSSSAGSCCSTV